MTGSHALRTGIATAIGVIGAAWSVMAGPSDEAAITIWVLNQANVSEEVLLRAKAETARIYDGAGVTVLWRNTLEADAPGRFIVNVVSDPLNGLGEIASDGVMGIAPGTKEASGIHAWAFYASIQLFAALHGLDAGLVLGHVMAHEIGHLLLRNNSHSQTGVMRAGWDRLQVTRAVARMLTFTPEEAALIRRRLGSSNTGPGNSSPRDAASSLKPQY